jgi:hypothetical protein
MEIGRQLSRSLDISAKVPIVFQKRVKVAQEHFAEQLKKAVDHNLGALLTQPAAAANMWPDWYNYAVDAAQRSILFWDTMRQRGNNFVEHASAGLAPVLHFAYETVVDGRKLVRPVNYALVRIIPPEGVTVDPKRRPYIIIDPRAGHGPGIGGFKDRLPRVVARDAARSVAPHSRRAGDHRALRARAGARDTCRSCWRIEVIGKSS